jgi:hypothetical protein
MVFSVLVRVNWCVMGCDLSALGHASPLVGISPDERQHGAALPKARNADCVDPIIEDNTILSPARMYSIAMFNFVDRYCYLGRCL